MSKTVWVEFTQPTLNYAKGDVVELDEERKDMVDAVIKKHFGKVEEDGGRSRYKVVDAPKADKKVSTVVDGVNDTAVEKKQQGKVEGDKPAKTDGDTPPAAGAGK